MVGEVGYQSVFIKSLTTQGLLGWTTMAEGTAYYMHVDEVMVDPAAWHGKPLQVHGVAENISVRTRTMEYRFDIRNNGHDGEYRRTQPKSIRTHWLGRTHPFTPSSSSWRKPTSTSRSCRRWEPSDSSMCSGEPLKSSSVPSPVRDRWNIRLSAEVSRFTVAAAAPAARRVR